MAASGDSGSEDSLFSQSRRAIQLLLYTKKERERVVVVEERTNQFGERVTISP